MIDLDLHPPWAAFFAYALVGALFVAAGLLWRQLGSARQSQQATLDELGRESARHATVIDAASDAVISIDPDQRIVLFNAAAQRMFGCSAREAIGTDVSRFVPPEARERHRQLIREFARSGDAQRTMNRNRKVVALRSDGTRFPVEASISQADLPGGQPGSRLFTVLMRDVSEQRRAEEALSDSEARYRAIFDQAVVGIAQMDLEGRLLGVNARLCEMLGYSQAELLSLSLHDLTHPADLPGNQPRLDALAHGGPAFTMEKRCLRKDGSVVWVEAAFNGIRGPGGTVNSIVSTTIDIEARKAATDALQRSQEELRRLSSNLTRAREEERRHLARELHDELGQYLSAIKMDLATLARGAGGDAALAGRLERLLETVDETIVSARRIAADLRPAMLDDLGLNAALEWLARDWSSRARLAIDLDADPVDEVVDDDTATAVYRIVQEALTNITRHADAARAAVRLRSGDGRLALVIEDDGGGLAPGDVDKRGSHGLLGIRERVRALGGSARFANAAHGGFRLEVELPLERSDSRPGALR